MKHFQERLGYIFQEESLLRRALTHRSREKKNNNERLEFLGDAVLSLIVSTELYRRDANISEGELSRLRAALVKGETIARLASELMMGEYVFLGEGEQRSGGAHRESILAGVFEAVIGAIFLEGDFKKTQACVLQWYGDLFDRIETLTDVKDAKTILQEYLQANKMSLPVYTCITMGKPHQPKFEVICRVEGLPQEGRGLSTSRRKAEQLAAKEFLSRIGA